MTTISITPEQARSLSLIVGQTPDATDRVWLHTFEEYIHVDLDDEKGNTIVVFKIYENGKVVRLDPSGEFFHPPISEPYLTNEDIADKLG